GRVAVGRGSPEEWPTGVVPGLQLENLRTCFMQRRAFLSAALCLAMAGAVAPAQAQSGVTTIIVGLAPGGSMDSSARLLAERLQRALGGTYVVENRLGAGSRLAVGYTKRAEPD